VIKALMTGGRGGEPPVVVLGLSAANIRKLQEDKPILLDLAVLGLPSQKVMIFTGETEAKMAAELQGAGLRKFDEAEIQENP
jgi:hypothetical protein